MNDLEMTRLCAAAMFPDAAIRIDGDGEKSVVCVSLVWGGRYDPLHDDAQAMALVKRFRMHIWSNLDNWVASDRNQKTGYCYPDLNRAIVECVAKMAQTSDTPQQA